MDAKRRMTFDELTDLDEKYKDDPKQPKVGDVITLYGPEGEDKFTVGRVKLVGGTEFYRSLRHDTPNWVANTHSTRPFAVWVIERKALRVDDQLKGEEDGR